ncbi:MULTISPECIES: hypothetical protein [Prochlorococcus]|uniref:hypothetical protein n=1 Tax=Prochlorococcus TaxID=1218 RepID=UPI0007B3D703|nr:hypothetical protein [Prochlorococcus marinus]
MQALPAYVTFFVQLMAERRLCVPLAPQMGSQTKRFSDEDQKKFNPVMNPRHVAKDDDASHLRLIEGRRP